jgi:hypothetical protein
MDIRVDRASFFIAAYNLVCMGASFRRVRWLGTWGNPGIRNGIILTIYVATGVQLEVSLMVVLSIFLGHELVTRALRKRCRKQTRRVERIPANQER